MKTKSLLLCAAIVTSSVQGAIGINFQLSDLFTSNGNTIPLNSVGILVASTTNATFAQGSALSGISLVEGALFGGDDLILAVLTASDVTSSGNFGFNRNITPINFTSDFGQGDLLGFYWFPTIIGSSVVPSDSEVSYGFFRSDVIDVAANSSISFTTPADNGAYSLFNYDTENGGLVQKSVLTANLTVPIPEPSTYALMGLGLVVVGLIARRKKS